MQINIHSKELQAAVDRVLPVINKKSFNTPLKRIYLQADADGCLKVWATDLDQYVEVVDRYCLINGDKVFGIDVDDYKFIKKLNGYLSINLTEGDDGGAEIKCEKKTIKIRTFTDVIPPVPQFDDDIKPLAILPEAWLLETITKCDKFISHKSMSHWDGVSVNVAKQRIEASNGYYCVMRSLPSDAVKSSENCDSILLPDISIPVLKKVLNKKGDNMLSISQHESYIKMSSETCTYIVHRLRRQDGSFMTYPDFDKILAEHFDTGFVVQKADMIDVLKYDCELIKGFEKHEATPLILRVDNDRMGTYIASAKLEAFDEVDINHCTCDSGFVIACNPNMLYNAIELIDKPEFNCDVKRAVDPIILHGDEYKCWVFPVRITDKTDPRVDTLKKYMNAA